MTPIDEKITALERIYALYLSRTAGTETACGEKCADCCTDQVTVTTLEAYHIWRKLEDRNREELARRLAEAAGRPSFQPAITTNRLAEMCAAGQEPPQEEQTREAARCPMLVADLCRYYEWRPFHCRCMISKQKCAGTGAARMDDFTLTLNSVFLQVIEHLDTPGCTGNLLDMLPLMLTAEFRKHYRNGTCNCAAQGLAANRPLTKLMIPPEHRDRIGPVVTDLQSIRI